jgi:hypothetical protein
VDLIVGSLNRFLPLLLCSKIFLTIMLAVYMIGCVSAGYELLDRRLNWIALLLCWTFYNSSLFYGFVNYVFSIGAFLCALAFWLHCRKRMTWLRFVVCCALSLIVFLSHLSGFVFLCVACLSIALVEPGKKRLLPLIYELGLLVPPVILMASFMRHGGRYGSVSWGSVAAKLIHLLAVERTYSAPFDLFSIMVLVLCGAVLVFHARLRAPGAAIAGGVLLLLFVLTPNVLFTATAVDARFVVPAYLLLGLSFLPDWKRPQVAALCVLLLTFIVARTTEIAFAWRTVDARSRQVLAMGNAMPRYSRVYVEGVYMENKFDRGFPNLTPQWTVTRQADVSNLFASSAQQPLVSRQNGFALDPTSQGCPVAQLRSCTASYDYVWTNMTAADLRRKLTDLGTLVSSSEGTSLWKLRH